MKKYNNWKLSILLIAPFIFPWHFPEDRPFLMALSRDEGARGINIVKHHGGDPLIGFYVTYDMDGIIRNYRANYRSSYENNVFNIPLSTIRNICYPTDLAAKDDVFGIRIYFVPKRSGSDSLNKMKILIKKGICFEDPHRRFRHNGDEKHSNKSGFNLYYSPQVNSENDIEAQGKINSARGILTRTAIKGYFIGRHLIMGTGSGKLGGAGVVNTHFLRIEIIKNASNDLQLLLAIVDNNRNEPINITDTTRDGIVYCLRGQHAGASGRHPMGTACVKPCPSNCPD